MRNLSILLFLTGFLCAIPAEIKAQGTELHLENSRAEMRISLRGGVITEMNLLSLDVKPIHEYGHFICYDRWGPSSPEDEALGIPWHGEGSKVNWKLDRDVEIRKGVFFAEMSGYLPIVEMGIQRRIFLDKELPVFRIEETLSNQGDESKVFNMVQHPTLGAPFLDENTIVDTRVDSGFSQAGSLPPGPEDIIHWPLDTVDEVWGDQRFLTGDQSWWAAVVSYTLDEAEAYSWVTAVNPSLGLLLGYIWETADYPWLNLWANIVQGAPFARGLEFGSTGLHQPWPEILAMDEIFGRSLYQELESGEHAKKSYFAFMSEVPDDYQGVASVDLLDSILLIEEYGLAAGTRIEMDLRSLMQVAGDTSSSTSIGKVQTAPGQARLHIWPNPLGPEARISYDLPEAAEVSIRVFDLNGHLQILIDQGLQEAGKHSLELETTHLEEGVYTLVLYRGNFRVVRKIVKIDS